MVYESRDRMGQKFVLIGVRPVNSRGFGRASDDAYYSSSQIRTSHLRLKRFSKDKHKLVLTPS